MTPKKKWHDFDLEDKVFYCGLFALFIPLVAALWVFVGSLLWSLLG